MHDVLENSELFDESWYLERYDDVLQLGMSAAAHYVAIGAELLRDPGPNFSTAFYLQQHPDVAAAGVNPLYHYEAHGRTEGRQVAPAGWRQALPRPYEPISRLHAGPPVERPARVVSFYLPQFHPIPENNEWWGAGFTEWTNVRPALPQLNGHYQPHIPGDELGYYDLRDTEVQQKQVELAKLYGVEAFCFYFYWFAGKRLLETPIRNYLDDASLDLPFMLCWANENWSRRWDGRENDVLMAQEHSPEDDLAFIDHVAPYLRDPRYVRVNGRPMLLVYRPSLLPDPAATANRWRTWCRDNGIGEIHLAYTQSFESADPREYGFDAAIEFPPNNTGVPNITDQVRKFPKFSGNVYDWNVLVDRSMAYPTPRFPLYRGACPSWDNTARRGSNGAILWNSSPGRFTQWLTNAMHDTEARFADPEERFVFVNAWNEWAEGAHLEPDQRYGYAWLESVRVALANAAPVPTIRHDQPVVIAVDATDALSTEGVAEALAGLAGRHRVVLIVRPSDDTQGALSEDFETRAAEAGAGKVAILALVRELAERGDEVLVSIDASALVTASGSAQMVDPAILHELVAQLASDQKVGLISAPGTRLPGDATTVTPGLLSLAERLGLDPEDAADRAPWTGEAFCARTRALLPLASLAFAEHQFSTTSLSRQVGLSQDLARAFALSAQAMGLRAVEHGESPVERGHKHVVIVSHDAHPHGAQRLALHMARRYVELGVAVDIVLLEGGRLLEEFASVAPVHVLDVEHNGLAASRLLRALHKKGPGFAVANTTVSGSVLPLLKAAGYPVVSLIHEMPQVLEEYGLIHQARLIARHADAVMFPAAIVQRGFEEFLGEPVPQGRIRPQGLYLHNPHSDAQARALQRNAIRSKHQLRSDDQILLAVGFADHRKGVDLFADACLEVLEKNERAVALWVGHQGDPALIATIESRLTQAGVRDRVHFVGLIGNPEDYFAAADVFLLTSREDPFPSVVLEAMNAGVPVVAFKDVTGSEEIIRRGGGELVAAFDTSAMAQAAATYLEQPELAEEIGRQGRALTEREFRFRDYVLDIAETAGHGFSKVSVVVPNFNYERFIRDRLDTVVNQTLPIHELIVLDDASSDQSVDVIRDFASSSPVPVDLVVNEENSGSVFRQWIRGVERATGDYVWIAEADDLADPDLLDELLSAFVDPDVVMSYSQSRQMAADGAVLAEHYLDYVADVDPAKWTRPHVNPGIDEIRDALFLKNTVPNVSAVVFRRDHLLQTLRMHADEIMSYRNAGDWVAYLRLLERGKVAFSSRSLNSHRRHATSVTVGNSNLEHLREIVQVQRSVIQRHDLGSEHIERADRYAQTLYEQFGLATEQHPRITDHPDLAPLF